MAGYTVSMSIVFCCDGTGNEVGANLSNVLKLFRVLRKNEEQVVFYDPGVGTLTSSDIPALPTPFSSILQRICDPHVS